MKEKFKIKNCDRSKYIFLKAYSNCLKVTFLNVYPQHDMIFSEPCTSQLFKELT